MANITAVENKFFTVASETYENNLSSSISAGAVTVPVNSANEYDDGDHVVLTVEAGTGNEASFVGTKASAPNRFVNCQWTEGNLGVGHASGVTITDYDSATHHNLQTKGIRKFANDDGTLKTTAVQAALNISAAVPSDYTSLAQTATTIVPNGNRSYTMTFPGVNYTDRLSPGMRLRTVRSANAPTQCATFDGVNDYFSKSAPTGMTFTDDFVVSAWVKLSSYPASGGTIVSRASSGNGWIFSVNSSGQVALNGFTGSNFANVSRVVSYQSIPLNKWVHVAAQLDMSAFTATTTTSYVMIDGVDVPASVSRGGTNPIALTQGTNLEVGSYGGGTEFFPGKIAQAAVFSAKVTQATMRSYISQGLAGTEPTLISAYSLNNTLNDLNTTNANNLTANGGVLATTADSPFGGQADGTISATVDYGIIQKVTYGAPDTTVVVQVPEGCTIPTSGGVASVSYSQFKSPYGFPGQRDRWTIFAIFRGSNGTVPTPGTIAWQAIPGYQYVEPLGSWSRGYSSSIYSSRAAAGTVAVQATLSEASATESTTSLTTGLFFTNVTEAAAMLNRFVSTTSLAATTLYYNMKPNTLSQTLVVANGASMDTILSSENTYL